MAEKSIDEMMDEAFADMGLVPFDGDFPSTEEAQGKGGNIISLVNCAGLELSAAGRDWWDLLDDSENNPCLVFRDGAVFYVKTSKSGATEEAEAAPGIYRVACIETTKLGKEAKVTFALEVKFAGFPPTTITMDGRNYGEDRELRAAINGAGILFSPDPRAMRLMRNVARRLQTMRPPQRIFLVGGGLDTEAKNYHTHTMRIEKRPVAEWRERPPWVESLESDTVRVHPDAEPRKFAAPDFAKVKAHLQLIMDHGPDLFETKEAFICAMGFTLFGPILPQFLPEKLPHLIMAFIGTTGSGKTTTTRVMAEFWGTTPGAHGTWKGAMGRATELRDGLFAIDDLREGGGTVAFLVSSLFDGNQRLVATIDGKSRVASEFRGAAILTGETLHGASQSTYNRLVVAKFRKRESIQQIATAAHDELKRISPAEKTAITALAIAFLMQYDRARLSQLFSELGRIVNADKIGVSSRGVEIAIRFGICAALFRELLDFAGVDSGLTDHVAVAKWVSRQHVEQEKKATPAQLFLEALEAEMQDGGNVAITHAIKARDSWALTATEYKKPQRGGQVRVVQIFESKNDEGPKWVLVNPRPTLAMLKLDIAEPVVAESLEGAGLLNFVRRQDRRSRLQLRVQGVEGVEEIKGWLISMEALNEDEATAAHDDGDDQPW